MARVGRISEGCHPAAITGAKRVEYLGFSDLLDRWIYTRRGLEKLVAREGFPAPAFAINRGRNRAWKLKDIEEYEQHHPETTSVQAKTNKVIRYAKLNTQKRNDDYRWAARHDPWAND